MARPQKNGLDWFPLDTFLDEKIQFVEATHGIKGYAIVIKLLQKIYGHFGYFGEWNARAATLFANELRLPLKVVTDVVGTCVEEGIFSAEMFEKYGILTSAGIQRRYLAAARKRVDSNIKAEYALAEPTPKELWTEETPVSAPKTPVFPAESTESKSKIKNNNKNNIKVPPTVDEVERYLVAEIHLTGDVRDLAERFVAYNELKGWAHLDAWESALRLFCLQDARRGQSRSKSTPTKPNARRRQKNGITADAQSFDVDDFFQDAVTASYTGGTNND